MATRRVLLAWAGALALPAALAGCGAEEGIAAAQVSEPSALYEGQACPYGYSQGGIPDYFSEDGDADFVVTLDRLNGLMTRDAEQPVKRHVLEEKRDRSGRPTRIALYVDRSGVTIGQLDLVRAKYGWQVASMVSCASADAARVQESLARSERS